MPNFKTALVLASALTALSGCSHEDAPVGPVRSNARLLGAPSNGVTVERLSVPKYVTKVSPRAINARGAIVGNIQFAEQPMVSGVIWHPDGSLEIIPPPDGAIYSLPIDINNAGLVVGRAWKAHPNQFISFSWSSHNGTRALFEDNLPSSEAYSVSENGVVSGRTTTGTVTDWWVRMRDGSQHSVIGMWSRASAGALDPTGTALAGYMFPREAHACYPSIQPAAATWSESSGRLRLKDLGFGSEAQMINARGLVAGWVATEGCERVVALWSASGDLLATLPAGWKVGGLTENLVAFTSADGSPLLWNFLRGTDVERLPNLPGATSCAVTDVSEPYASGVCIVAGSGVAVRWKLPQR